MKRLFTLSILLLMALGIFAQMPKGFSYQAVVRNSSGKLVDNKQVGVRFSILQGSAEGSAVYTETQTLTTNANGLLTVAIGSGAGFDAIDWAGGSYFLKSEIDPNGGTDYTVTGVSQLLSVPYAMHAKTAESATETDPVFAAAFSVGNSQEGDLMRYNAATGKWESFTHDFAMGGHTHSAATTTTSGFMGAADKSKLDGVAAGAEVNVNADWNATSGDAQILNKPDVSVFATKAELAQKADKSQHYLGEEYLGGIIFYLYNDDSGEQHGLIVSKIESYQVLQTTPASTGADRSWDGAYNTSKLTGSPAKDWVVNTFSSEWYLPSIDEITLLHRNRFHVNKKLKSFTTGAQIITNLYYWSNTEPNGLSAYRFSMGAGYASDANKSSTNNVRAIRAF